MPLSDDCLAKLLTAFLKGAPAARIVRKYGARLASPNDYAGEMYCALHRQRPLEIDNPERWFSVNAKWQLKNSIRRERKNLLKQSAAQQFEE